MVASLFSRSMGSGSRSPRSRRSLPVRSPALAPERDASAAVQCTVFRVQTPGGEVFTLPVQEIRGLHTMTPELIENLQKAAENEDEEEGQTEGRSSETAGFAAYASLPKPVTEPAPDHPAE